MKSSTIVLIIAVVAVVGLSFNAGYNAGKSKTPPPETKSDTIWRTDTFRMEAPEPERITITKYIPYRVEVPGEIQHDTIVVSLPIEEKEYADSTYRLQISGFNANLDWIDIYQKSQTITNTIVTPRKKWGFSVVAGPSVIYSPFSRRVDAGIGITAGVSYTF